MRLTVAKPLEAVRTISFEDPADVMKFHHRDPLGLVSSGQEGRLGRLRILLRDCNETSADERSQAER